MISLEIRKQKQPQTFDRGEDGVGGGVHFVLSPVFARIKKPSAGHSNSTIWTIDNDSTSMTSWKNRGLSEKSC